MKVNEIMAKRAPKKVPQPTSQPVFPASLRQALSRQKKEDLVNALLELAQADRGVLRQLQACFEMPAIPEELLAATRQAIADATAFDQRDINRNFAYDSDAYSEVQRNLGHLIASGNLQQAMELALELMKQGSHQVEMSDEGLMTEDIVACLSVVLTNLKSSNLPAEEIITWCSAMLANDRVGFIAQEPLQSLRRHFLALAAR